MNTSQLNTMSPKEITQSYLDALEKNPDLFRQFALYAFYGDLCQEKAAPVDSYLGAFILYPEIFFQQLDKALPDQKKRFIASVKLDEFLLRKTFFHYWDQGFYGRPFFTGGDRNIAAVQYLSEGENIRRIGLSGGSFMDMLKLHETQEGLARNQPTNDDIIHTIKDQIRKRYLVEQRIFFKLLGESGTSSGTASEVGDKVSGIL